MAKLKWGLPKIEACLLVAGAIPVTPTWIELRNPVENTAKLTTTSGNEVNAPIEGGEIIASRRSANSYTFEVELYANDAVAKPISDTNGVVAGEYAIRITPEDSTLYGFIMDKSAVSVEDTFDAQIGQKWKYIFKGLKPTTGNIVKEYDPA